MTRARITTGSFDRSPKRYRRGSALLICTLAMAVLSLASIAVVRSNQRSIMNIDGIRASRQARLSAEGAIQRSIAAIRIAPKTTGILPLKGPYPTGSTLELTALSPNATRIRVYLYDRAKVPAAELTIDPTALAGAGLPAKGVSVSLKVNTGI